MKTLVTIIIFLSLIYYSLSNLTKTTAGIELTTEKHEYVSAVPISGGIYSEYTLKRDSSVKKKVWGTTFPFFHG